MNTFSNRFPEGKKRERKRERERKKCRGNVGETGVLFVIDFFEPSRLIIPLARVNALLVCGFVNTLLIIRLVR